MKIRRERNASDLAKSYMLGRTQPGKDSQRSIDSSKFKTSLLDLHAAVPKKFFIAVHEPQVTQSVLGAPVGLASHRGCPALPNQKRGKLAQASPRIDTLQ